MKRPRLLSIVTLLSLMSGLTVRAEKLDEWIKLLPKNTVGFVSIKSAPELLADWDKSSFAKLMEDEEFKKWTAPMYKDGEALWDKEIKENTGEGLRDNLKRLKGSVMLAVVADSPADFEGERTPMALLMEVGDDHAKIEELIAKETERSIAEDSTLKASTKDIAGVEVHIVTESEEEGEPWKKAHAFVGDVMIMADEPAIMEQFIALLKNGNAEPSVVVQNHLQRAAQFTEGNTDITIYMNGETLVQWGLDTAKKSAAESAQAMPVSPEQIMGALGLEEFQSIVFTVDLADDQSRVDAAVLHPEKPTGFVSLLRGVPGEVHFAPFIPQGVISAGTTRYSLLELWDKLLVIVNKMGPMAAMATMQLGGVEAQVGIKIREDLFGSLADEYVEVTDGSLEKQSQVFAIKVKDHQRLAGALESVKGFVGAGFAAFEESEFLGHQISTVKTANATPDSPEIAFCLTNDYLLFSTGPQALLKKVLTQMGEPSAPNVWQDDRVQDLIARLPKGYIGVGFADGGKMAKLVVDTMTMVQSQTGKSAKKKKSKKGKGPKAEAEVTDEEIADAPAETWFDANAMPSDGFWKRYIGSSVSGSYIPADALHYRVLSTPVKAE